MKKGLHFLLIAAILGLGYWIFNQIQVNVSYQEEFEAREMVVKSHLEDIKKVAKFHSERDAERKFFSTWDEFDAYVQNAKYFDTVEIYDTNSLEYPELEAKAKAENPNWVNYTVEVVTVRESVLGHIKSDEDIKNLRYVPYSNGKEFQLTTVIDENGTHLFRCHAPYSYFIDTEKYQTQFWNLIEDKFDYFVKNEEPSEKMRNIHRDGLIKALELVPSQREEGKMVPKYYIGAKNPIALDVEFFGLTIGGLEKRSLDDNWSDKRAK